MFATIFAIIIFASAIFVAITWTARTMTMFLTWGFTRARSTSMTRPKMIMSISSSDQSNLPWSVGFVFDALQRVLQRTDQNTASIIRGNLRLLDQRDGRDQRFNSCAKITPRRILNSPSDGTARDGLVPFHDLLKFRFTDRGVAARFVTSIDGTTVIRDRGGADQGQGVRVEDASRRKPAFPFLNTRSNNLLLGQGPVDQDSSQVDVDQES